MVRIEAIQRRFTKRLSGFFPELSYDERLASLNCESLYSRRVKCDLVMCCQMLTGSVDIDTDAFFARSYLSSGLRNDLYCVEWDVKLYYTIPYHPTLVLLAGTRRKFSNPNLHQYTMVTFSVTELLTIGIRFRIALSHHHSFKRKLRSLNFHL